MPKPSAHRRLPESKRSPNIEPTGCKTFFPELILLTLLLPVLASAASLAVGQEGGKPPGSTIIKAGRLIDVRASRVLTDQAILVVSKRVKAVGDTAEILQSAPKDSAVIDLSKATCPAGAD
jgi:hypothetical protein